MSQEQSQDNSQIGMVGISTDSEGENTEVEIKKRIEKSEAEVEGSNALQVNNSEKKESKRTDTERSDGSQKSDDPEKPNYTETPRVAESIKSKDTSGSKSSAKPVVVAQQVLEASPSAVPSAQMMLAMMNSLAVITKQLQDTANIQLEVSRNLLKFENEHIRSLEVSVDTSTPKQSSNNSEVETLKRKLVETHSELNEDHTKKMKPTEMDNLRKEVEELKMKLENQNVKPLAEDEKIPAFFQATSPEVLELLSMNISQKQITRKDRNLDEIKKFILQLEAQRQDNTDEPKIQKVFNKPNSEIKCYKCNHKGHWQSECRLGEDEWYCYGCVKVTTHKSTECPKMIGQSQSHYKRSNKSFNNKNFSNNKGKNNQQGVRSRVNNSGKIIKFNKNRGGGNSKKAIDDEEKQYEYN